MAAPGSIAGPGWKGAAPKGIKGVIRSETDFGYALYRTQLFAPDDIENVKQVQAGYKVQTLSQFLGKPAPARGPAGAMDQAAHAQNSRKPRWTSSTSLNFVLQAAPTHPSEQALFERFARISVGTGRTFDPAKLSPEIRSAMEAGMADAWKEFKEFKTQNVDTGKVGSGDFFGTREFLKNDYMRRMTGAILGIYGNSKRGGDIPGVLRRQRGAEARRREGALHVALRARAAAAGRSVLVADDVRAAREPALCQPAQPLPDQLADAAAAET